MVTIAHNGVLCVDASVKKRLVNISQSADLQECRCPPSMFPDNLPNGFTCSVCAIGSVCLGGEAKPEQCQKHTTTILPGGASWSDCICAAGFEKRAIPECISCPKRTFKIRPGDTACDGKCTPHSTTEPGATKHTDCFWLPEYFKEGESCVPRLLAGLNCPGGFVPNTTMHIMPAAVVGYHLTGKAKAEVCKLDAGEGHLCLEAK